MQPSFAGTLFAALSDFWQDHWELSVAAALLLLAQAATIVWLAISHRRRRLAEAHLLQSDERSRAQLSAALEHKRQYEEGLRLLLELNQQASAMTEKQTCDLALDIAVRMTRSSIGYLHFVNEDQNTISLGTWNAQAMKNCTAAYNSHYPLAVAGIWADSARQRRPVIHNDYQNMQDKKSCPQGHAHLLRHMSVPVLDGDKVRMIIGVGNKAGEYVEEDARQLQQVANEVQKIVMKRRAEEALQESEARFRFITDLSPGLVWVSDTSGRCIWFNKTWLAYTGRSLAEEAGDGWTKGVHRDDYDHCMQTYLSHFEARRPFSMEYRLRRRDGEYRWMLDAGQPRFDQNGAFLGYVGSCLDITEGKRSEELIRQSKVLLQAVIDSIPDWIHVKDGEHRFMLVNQAFARAFEQTPESMVGRFDTDFLPPEICAGNAQLGIPSLHDDDDAIFKGKSVHYPQIKIAFRSGAVRVFDTFRGPLRDPDQRVYGILTYRRDITERYSTEQEQRVLENQLRQAQKMELIGHLTGGIAHDFNNILAAMFGYAELAQMSPALEQHPELGTYLLEILQAGIRAKELVAQLLTFSHRKEAVSEAISVAPIVREVAKLLRSTFPATIAISTVLPKALPEARVSAVHLHQVLMNLGINARDAMDGKGSVDIRLEPAVISSSRPCSSCHLNFSGTYLMISVTDSGVGISEDHLAKIFDPFFTTKDVGHGSGLGLSVVHGIVHSANGHIEVLTAPGAGTEFRIYLPAETMKLERVAGSLQKNGSYAVASGHVLVVDDESSIVGFMTTLLENLGCRVTGLTSATEALHLFESDPQAIDMVITDQTMPDLTGAELARAMLAVRPDLPVVLATGYSNSIDEGAARRIGVRRFLMKPVPARILADVIAECLGEKVAGG